MAKIYNKTKYKNKKPYFKIRNKAWEFLIDNNIKSYPLDLRKIAIQNNWTIWSYTEYCQYNKVDEIELISKHPDGFTLKLDKDTQLICYNQNNNRWRNRFTIAHEMAHIILHKYLSGKELEKEANMFASRILMPMVLIKELNITTAEELSKLCNVSIESATYRIKRYNNIKGRERFYTNKYETALYNQLKPFIDEVKK